MTKYEKMLQWTKRQKWLFPLGFGMLIAMAAALMGLCFASGLHLLARGWIYNIGADVCGILVCTALFYGCMTGKDSQEETTYHFLSLLVFNGYTLFLDGCMWLVQGIPSLRGLNLLVIVLFFQQGPIITYQFWRYICLTLSFDSRLMRGATRTLRILQIPAILLCWVNLFTPLYFSLDADCVYRTEPLYPLRLVYLALATVFLLIGLTQSGAPKRHKRIMVSFVTLPILNAVLTFFTQSISTQYIATLISIVLVYSVVYADRSNLLASTATELNMASGIQAHMLPNIFPAFPERSEFDIYASMEPAKEVGGDFYDFFMIGDDHLGMVVADVSGKGVPAALFSMIAKTMLKTQAQTRLSPERVLLEVNASLTENNEEDMFVTVWLGVLQISTGELTYADAGHEKLLLYQDGAWTFLPKRGGPALAMWEPEDL